MKFVLAMETKNNERFGLASLIVVFIVWSMKYAKSRCTLCARISATRRERSAVDLASGQSRSLLHFLTLGLSPRAACIVLWMRLSVSRESRSSIRPIVIIARCYTCRPRGSNRAVLFAFGSAATKVESNCVGIITFLSQHAIYCRD